MFKNFSDTDLLLLMKQQKRRLLNMTLMTVEESKSIQKEIKSIKKELKKRGVKWQD